jgi:hypothetical protein
MRTEVGGPVRHFKTPDGLWEKTDMKAVASPLNKITNAHGGGYTHYYPKAMVPIEIDQVSGAMKMDFGDGVSISIGGNPNLNGEFTAGANPTIAKSFTNFDVKYIARADGLKRWWKIKKPSPNPIREFKSPVKCVGCNVVNNKVVSLSGEVLATFNSAFYHELSAWWNPFTKDGPIKHASIEVDNDFYTVTVDTTGMKFPIVVDPTLTVTTSTADNFMFLSRPNDNWGGAAAMGCYGLPGATQRPIVLMDISALPPGATITSTIFSLYVNLKGSSFSGTLELKRVIQAWVEGTQGDAGGPEPGSCTWNSYGAAAWATPGGDITETDKATVAVPAVNTWADWVATNQAIYAQQNNSGLFDARVNLLDEANPNATDNLQFYSRQSGTAFLPKIVVEYTEALVGGPISAAISGPISAPIVTPT